MDTSRRPHLLDALPLTLAQRVQVLRQRKHLTQLGLAEKANLSLAAIRDIESGLDLFLATAVRLKLARALGINPGVLKVVERPVDDAGGDDAARHLPLLIQVLDDPEAGYTCPDCSERLVIRCFAREDMNETPMTEVKIHCSQC
ncbi:MAG: helix-turn-helix transcriptional regulator, partial [Cyanobacteria bacterium HKST-UBA05]|nr:helix-turn-helix transcriptional regulator [Cyanobacteria bacterium HKST-UBA05]